MNSTKKFAIQRSLDWQMLSSVLCLQKIGRYCTTRSDKSVLYGQPDQLRRNCVEDGVPVLAAEG
jgi:hypothetical protein